MWKSCKNLIFNKKHRLVRHYVNCKEYTSLIYILSRGKRGHRMHCRHCQTLQKFLPHIGTQIRCGFFFLLKKNNISISLANMEFLRIKIEIRNVFYFLHSLLFIPPKKDRESRVFARQSASKKAHEKDFKGAVTRYIYDF